MRRQDQPTATSLMKSIRSNVFHFNHRRGYSFLRLIVGVLKTTKDPDHQLSPEDSSLFDIMKCLKRSGLLKVLSTASMYSLGQWAIIIPPSRVSSGEGMPTELSMPSCSVLPDIWTPEMDLYVIQVVMREKARPLHLTKVVKNRFPELLNVSTLLPSRS